MPLTRVRPKVMQVVLMSRYKKNDKKVQVESSSCSINSGICWQVVGGIVQIRNLNVRPSGLAAFNTVKESA